MRRVASRLGAGFLAAAGACAQFVRPGLQADAPVAAHATLAPLQTALQQLLDSAQSAGRFPGAALALVTADGAAITVASGMSDTARKVAMRTTDRLLQGSVGKTYVAAVAMQLVAEGALDLDAPVSRYLGQEPWFPRLPNARTMTVRQLMNHTSGLVRYEFQPEATAMFRAQPLRRWTPEERLAFVFDRPPPFEAGRGWEYSDTNYIVLGMIIERLTGRSYYAELNRRLLAPLGLTNTIPSDTVDLPRLAMGYAGAQNELGGYDASLVAGRMVFNPQMEWTGGGIASTTEDLARWAKLLYEGRAFPARMLEQMLDGVPARLGAGSRYGLGVIIRETPLGRSYGHSGFFPGYATEMIYLPRTRVAVALQINTTSPYPRGMVPLLLRAAALASTADTR